MNAKTKKTILILLTVIFILSIFSFIGCAPEKLYSVSLRIDSVWLENSTVTLTSETPSIEMYGGEKNTRQILSPVLEIRSGIFCMKKKLKKEFPCTEKIVKMWTMNIVIK